MGILTVNRIIYLETKQVSIRIPEYNFLLQLIATLKMRWLYSLGYMIKDIFSVEEILSVETKGGQEIIKRKIYTPVKQKEKIILPIL